jgi:hypothetical protein
MSFSQVAGRIPRRVMVATAAAASAGALIVGITAVAGAAGATAAPRAARAAAAHSFSFSFKRSPGIAVCAPHAGGRVTITPGHLNDIMTISLHGMPHSTAYDLFVIQQPNKPFGISWYQTDINVGVHGTGSAKVRGIFDSETFSVSPGGTTTFGPTHQFHLGLWFNNPRVPFRLGCEGTATAPVVTPFNGEQHAGIQILNTANFALNKGPLSHVHR